MTSVLDQDLDENAMLIDGSPQPMAFAADLQCHLIEMHLSPARTLRRRSFAAEVAPNLAHHRGRSRGWRRPALGKQILNVKEAEVEAKLRPYRSGRYRIGEGQLEVDSIELVPFFSIDDSDLRRSRESDLDPSANP